MKYKLFKVWQSNNEFQSNEFLPLWISYLMEFTFSVVCNGEVKFCKIPLIDIRANVNSNLYIMPSTVSSEEFTSLKFNWSQKYKLVTKWSKGWHSSTCLLSSETFPKTLFLPPSEDTPMRMHDFNITHIIYVTYNSFNSFFLQEINERRGHSWSCKDKNCQSGIRNWWRLCQ